MSYEATSRSTVNTRVASEAIRRIGEKFFLAAEKIRQGAVSCNEYTDKIMNSKKECRFSVSEIKYLYKESLDENIRNKNFQTLAEAKYASLTSIPELQVNSNNVAVINEIRQNPGILKTSQGNMKISRAVEETFTLIKKRSVDIQTIIVTKAALECSWNIIDAKSEATMQTIIAQNKQGSVMAVNIQPENISIDIAGYEDNSCQQKAEEFFQTLRKFGIMTSVESQRKHGRPKGGELLSMGKSAQAVHMKASGIEKQKKAGTVSIPATTGSNIESKIRLNESETKRIKENG